MENGIRYTQIVLITRLRKLSPRESDTVEGPPVLVVHITGENTNTDYTDAKAAFRVALEDTPLELQLDGGIVYSPSVTNGTVVGVVNIPPSGLDVLSGETLRFRGSMPPALSGAMTVLLPLTTPADQAILDALLDFDFDTEYRRVEHSWKAQMSGNPAGILPVQLDQP